MRKTYYWSLVITSYFASVALWSREDSETTVVAYGPEIPWEKDEELTPAIDASLSEVISQMPEDAGEPTKTVFGVMSGWVSEGHIKKEHLARIRELCGKLSLSPVGFVVLPEALSYDVKQNEGGPLSGAVIGIGRDILEVSLYRMGTLGGTVEVNRSVSLSEDLIEALSRFSSNDPLPSRFIVYGVSSEEFHDVAHLLSSVSWKDVNPKLDFLHEPKIEMVDSDRILVAISAAGSSEMGPVKSLIVPPKRGGHDENLQNVVSADISVNDLGFAVDGDIAEIEGADEEVASGEEEESEAMHATHAPAAHTLLNRVKGFIPTTKVLSSFKRHDNQLPVERMHQTHSSVPAAKLKKMAIASGVALLLFCGALFAAWYLLPHADITIFISPRTLTARETFTLQPDAASANLDLKTLPAKALTKEVSGEESAPTTGVKTVGDKAVGKVTVRNGTANDVKLPAGALLTGPNDLKFTLDQSASVSAATSPSSPGTATINATAGAIGPDSNIAQDTSLKVGNFLSSEIDAIVTEAFSGGTSRQISAVSKADLDGLEKTLTQSLVADAQSKMVEEVPEGYEFIVDSVTTKVSSKTFDHKVGDEASQISLKLVAEAQSYAVPQNAISDMAQKLLASQVPSGYSFRPEQVKTSFEIQKGNALVASIGLTANLLPDVSPDDVARSISGKRLNRANDILSAIPGFVRSSITVRPAFPDALRFLPFSTKRIEISIEAEK